MQFPRVPDFFFCWCRLPSSQLACSPVRPPPSLQFTRLQVRCLQSRLALSLAWSPPLLQLARVSWTLLLWGSLGFLGLRSWCCNFSCLRSVRYNFSDLLCAFVLRLPFFVYNSSCCCVYRYLLTILLRRRFPRLWFAGVIAFGVGLGCDLSADPLSFCCYAPYFLCGRVV